MSVIDEMLDRIVSFSENIEDYIRLEIIENEAIICDMNSETQLFEKGINADGVSIESYAPYQPITKQIKLAKGQPTNRVTLRDTGEFHASFRVTAGESSFYIDATDWKAEKLTIGYGDDIFGLTDENINELIWEYIYPMLIKKLEEI